jgi:hypothetical protein
VEWPFIQSFNRAVAGGLVTASTTLTTLTGGASAHTKGSAVELVSAANNPGFDLLVVMLMTGTTAREALIDILEGDSNKVVVPDLYISNNLTAWSAAYKIPLSRPPGRKISARAQTSDASGTVACAVALFKGAFLNPLGFTRCTAYGVDAANTGGVSVSAGGTANTRVVTQIASSVANPIKSAIISAGSGGDITLGDISLFVDLCMGASDKVVVPPYHFRTTVSESFVGMPTPALPCFIPAGKKLALGVQSDSSNTGFNTLDYIVHGLD